MDNLVTLYTMATNFAFQTQQTVGKKHDYYITLEQLERLIKRIDLLNDGEIL